ncbi:MAG: hypothetical protein ACYC4N_26770 [Pirellulaceae bacterium]
MTKEMGYNVRGGCGATIIFGITHDGDLYAELGGNIYDNEDMLETFAKDCERTLDAIRDDLKDEDDPEGDLDEEDDLDEEGDLDEDDDA